jgi:hypothetical protein
MRHDEGQGDEVPRSHVDEMDVDVIDCRHELRQGIGLRFRLRPVVVCAPVAHERLQRFQLDALRSIRHGFAVRPPRGGDAPAEVIELGLGYVNGEGADRAIFGRLVRGRRRGDNGGVGVKGGHGLSVVRRGEHEYADSKRGYRTGKRQFLERHGRILSRPSILTARRESVIGVAIGMPPGTLRRRAPAAPHADPKHVKAGIVRPRMKRTFGAPSAARPFNYGAI